MLIYYLASATDDLTLALVLAAAVATSLIIGIAFHEFSHAFVADNLGDRLPRARGRVTLNPLAHLDRTGTILMVLIGFGWGKPVPINPNATRNPKASLAMTSFAGPFSNFIVAAAAGLPIKLDAVPWISPPGFNTTFFDAYANQGFTNEQYLGLFLSSVVLFNCILGIFNLIPIAPLDGFNLAIGLLPRDLSREFAKLGEYGPLILLILLALPFLTGGQLGILFEVMQPAIEVLIRLFTGAHGNQVFF